MKLFPFSAVVGLEHAKRSLLLHAVEPRLGGTLLLGHRGCAKTTLARAFGGLLPGDAPFVDVPLGATEDRLLGSVDAGVLLESGLWNAKSGLIEQADGGVLYIDEINLLADHLADFLLDSAATGQHRVERDGIARHVSSRYVLIGSMNPDEGELRPQLTDRFAHGVRIVDDFSAAERVEIARRRMDFDDDADAFCAQYADADTALREQILQGRLRLKQVVIGESERLSVAEHARELGVEGVRAELAVLRTARAAAAWDGRESITPDDLTEAWTLCLEHRETHNKPAAPPPPSTSRPPRPPVPNQPAHGTPPTPRDASLEVRQLAESSHHIHSSLAQWWDTKSPDLQNRPTKATSVQRHGESIAWVASLIASMRNGWTPGRSNTSRWHLRFHAINRKPHAWIFLDASRSTGAFLASARDAISQIVGGAVRFRFNILLLQAGSVRWVARKSGMRHGLAAMDNIREVGGTSDLPLALKQLHRASLRHGESPQDRIVICTDGFATQRANETGAATTRRLREALRHLGMGSASVAWLHPSPIGGLRGMSGWFQRLASGTQITRFAISPISIE